MTLKRVDPPRQADKVSIDQAWLRLQEAIAAADAEIGGEAGLSNVLFVDLVTGDNLTAQRGSLVFKYATIQAALNAALAGDTVWVSPGTYIEELVWPSVNGVTLRGTGPTPSTMIVSDGASPLIRIVPTVSITSAIVRDLTLVHSTQDCIRVDGGVTFDTMFEGSGLILENLGMNREVDLRSINNVHIHNVVTENSAAGILRTSNVSQVTVDDSKFYQMDLDYDLAPANPPTNGNIGLVATNCMVYNSVTYRDLAKAAFGDECQLGSVVGLPIDNVTNDCGFISCSGRVVGGINIDFNFTNAMEGGDYEVCRFDYCRIGELLDVAGTGDQEGLANARNAILYNEAGPHTAGALCRMDLRGTLVTQSSLAVAADGTIDRDTHYVEHPIGSGIGLQTVTISPPFPSWANYQVIVEVADGSDGAVAITGKTSTGFERTTVADNVGMIRFGVVRLLHV